MSQRVLELCAHRLVPFGFAAPLRPALSGFPPLARWPSLSAASCFLIEIDPPRVQTQDVVLWRRRRLSDGESSRPARPAGTQLRCGVHQSCGAGCVEIDHLSTPPKSMMRHSRAEGGQRFHTFRPAHGRCSPLTAERSWHRRRQRLTAVTGAHATFNTIPCQALGARCAEVSRHAWSHCFRRPRQGCNQWLGINTDKHRRQRILALLIGFARPVRPGYRKPTLFARKLQGIDGAKCMHH